MEGYGALLPRFQSKCPALCPPAPSSSTDSCIHFLWLVVTYFFNRWEYYVSIGVKGAVAHQSPSLWNGTSNASLLSWGVTKQTKARHLVLACRRCSGSDSLAPRLRSLGPACLTWKLGVGHTQPVRRGRSRKQKLSGHRALFHFSSYSETHHGCFSNSSQPLLVLTGGQSITSILQMKKLRQGELDVSGLANMYVKILTV